MPMQQYRSRLTAVAGGLVILSFVLAAPILQGDTTATPQRGAEPGPTNTLPNPYRTVANYFQLPPGRVWGSTSAVEIDRDGRSIWVAERCGQNNCFDRQSGRMSELPTILKFDANGNLLTSFGAGLLVFPHGFHVDRDGNIWVTDGQDNGPPRPAAAPG